MSRARPLLMLLGLVAALATLFVEAPANWLAKRVAAQSDGAVLLSDAEGSLWHGSAVLSFGGTLERPAASLSLPGRIEWKFAGLAGARLHYVIAGDAFAGPLSVQFGMRQVALGPGAMHLPCELLESAGGAMQTLKLRCVADLDWQAVSWPLAPTVKASGSVTLRGLSSALTTVRPLGDYRIDWQSGAGAAIDYRVKTLSGALEITGTGTSPGHFSGLARVAANTPAASAEALKSLLATLGSSGPDGTQLQY